MAGTVDWSQRPRPIMARQKKSGSELSWVLNKIIASGGCFFLFCSLPSPPFSFFFARKH
jgi:hypothetical protein